MDGNIKLRVWLPNRRITMFIPASTTMDVLLMQICRNVCLDYRYYRMNVFNNQFETIDFIDSTCIGSLNTNTIQLVEREVKKKENLGTKRFTDLIYFKRIENKSWFKKLLDLKFDAITLGKKYKTFFHDQMFDFTNEIGAQVVLYFLFEKLWPQLVQKELGSCFPPRNDAQFTRFYEQCAKWLRSIAKISSDNYSFALNSELILKKNYGVQFYGIIDDLIDAVTCLKDKTDLCELISSELYSQQLNNLLTPELETPTFELSPRDFVSDGPW